MKGKIGEREIGTHTFSFRLKETVRLAAPRRAVVKIFDEGRADKVDESGLLSEPVLAQDWNRPEEDAAWSHLQSAR